MRVILPNRRPPKHAYPRILQLDHKYLPGNELTMKQLKRGYLFWVYDNLKVVAYILLEDYKSTSTIRSIVVLPEYRRLGLARKMLRSCIRWVTNEGGSTIHTYTSAYNYSSMNLLIGLGFKILKCYETYSNMDKRHVPWISFRRNMW